MAVDVPADSPDDVDSSQDAHDPDHGQVPEARELDSALGDEESIGQGPLTLNLGGEGELDGDRVININLMSVKVDDVEQRMLLRSLESIKDREQPIVRAEMACLPIASGSIDMVHGKSTPFQHGEWAEAVASEAYRVLSPGGQVRLHSSNLGGGGWLPYLEKAGFGQLGLTGGYATGIKE